MSALAIVLLSVGYPMIGAAVGRLAGGHVAYSVGTRLRPDWFAGFFSGIAAGAVWPLTLAMWAASTLMPVGAERDVRLQAENERLRRERAERDREIERLERVIRP